MKKQKNFNLIISIIIFVLLIPVVLLSFYNHPNFDDYAYSINTYQCVKNNCGIVNLIIESFKTSFHFMYSWQGLYSSAVLLSLQPAIFGEKFYFLTTFFLIISIFLGIYIFVKSIYRYILKKEKSIMFKLLLSLVIEFFLIETAPSGKETLYWFNGSVNYVFFWSILLIIFSSYLTYYFSEKKRPIFLLILTFLAFVLSGGNHITAVAGIIIGIVFSVLSVIKKKQRLIIFPLMVGISGFLINVNSPGTKIRANELSQYKVGIFDTIYHTFLKSFGLFSEWFSLSLIAIIILLMCLIWNDLKNLKIEYSKKTLLIPFISYILIEVMMCVPYYILGNYGAGRVYNVLYFTFSILIFINVFLLFKYLKDKKIVKINITENFKKGIILIICTIFIGIIGNNFYFCSTSLEAFNELTSGIAQKFSEQTDDRVSMLENDKIDEVIVEPYSVKPILLYNTDFCEINEKNTCTNNYINQYYNKKVVGIK